MSAELEKTWSICPVCRKRIPALWRRKGKGIVLGKKCPEHGKFFAPLWKGYLDPDQWKGKIRPVTEEESRNCASCPGIGECSSHRRDTCCTLLEVTERCNMNCAFCFAPSRSREDPSAGQVKAWILDLTVPGKTFLQLSGGEPTLRDDLPEIIRFAKTAGCKYVQVNTNGLRLAQDEAYVKELAEAGLDIVFLSFDGVNEDVYLKLRRRPMMEIKKKAIENCGKYGIGVTLVPVIVPGVNEQEIGEILRFGIARSPIVRGIHFQPVSFFGRIPYEPKAEDRFTLDQMIWELAKQSGGLVNMRNLIPSCCDHPLCGFHGDFIVMPDRTLLPLSKKRSCCCGAPEPETDPAEMNREFVGRRWSAAAAERPETAESAEPDMSDMDTFINRVKRYSFTLTSMAFQDAWNLDMERLMQCSLHVYKDGRIRPFCITYI
ncbi:MAG: radical SAM protein [Lachnospiraceae bacterium]|nr:radical SAM protein [Lachnospiraceae bacterium]